MTQMLLIYVPCESQNQAHELAKHLLKKRLIACANIIPSMLSCYFSDQAEITESHESLLLVKTIKQKLDSLEKEISKLHPYETPCILAISIEKSNKKYLDWILDQLKE